MYMTNIRMIHFYQYIWGKFNEIFLQRNDKFILFAKTFDCKPVQFLWAVESPHKYRNILVRFFTSFY